MKDIHDVFKDAWFDFTETIYDNWRKQNDLDDTDQTRDLFDESDDNLRILYWVMKEADHIPEEMRTLLRLKFG